MQVDVRIPTLGESINEGVIVRWLKTDGDAVRVDEPLLELETDKANVELPSPSGGVLQRLKQEGETVRVGDVVAHIDAATKPTPASVSGAQAASAPTSSASPAPAPAPPSPPRLAPAPPAPGDSTQSLSPAVRKLVAEHSLDPTAIKGSGRGGRLTKADILTHLEEQEREQSAGAPVRATEPRTGAALADIESDVQRVPMSRLRQRIAERLVQAQHTAAILTTFNEVDMTAVMDLRNRHKQRFAEVHKVPLGFMSFFARACINALHAMPIINAQIDGADIVYHRHVNLGVAVATERGLVVPIIHRADMLSFAEIEQSIARLADAARDNKLSIEDLSRGTFTISNGGVFGSLLSTPILNPPQSAILGMHKIEKRPVVVGDQIVIRPMMYLAVSYDHRLIDGADAVRFLVRVKENLEDPTRLLLDL